MGARSGLRRTGLVVAVARQKSAGVVAGEAAAPAGRGFLGRGAEGAETASGAGVGRVAGEAAGNAEASPPSLVHGLRGLPPSPAPAAEPPARADRP